MSQVSLYVNIASTVNVSHDRGLSGLGFLISNTIYNTILFADQFEFTRSNTLVDMPDIPRNVPEFFDTKMKLDY